MAAVSPFSRTGGGGKHTCVDSLSSPTLIKCFNENASPPKIDRVLGGHRVEDDRAREFTKALSFISLPVSLDP